MVRFWINFFVALIFTSLFFGPLTKSAQADFCTFGPEFADCIPTSQLSSLGINIASPPTGYSYRSCTDGRTGDLTPYTCLQRNLPLNSCPTSGATCRPYGEVGSPGPVLGGWIGCEATDPTTQTTTVYACCTAGYNTAGHCISIADWVDYVGGCCDAGATSCTVGGQAGYCAHSARSNDLCEGRGHCEVAPTNTTEPGTFLCNCTLGQGSWTCSPQANAGLSNATGCAAWAVPDTGRCAPNVSIGQIRDLCDRSDGGRCSTVLSCVSQVTTPENPLKGHGETCTFNPTNDECNTAQGLYCRIVDGQSGNYRCAYQAGSRGGPNSVGASSCRFEDECITQIGIDDSPANDYQCTSAPGVACDMNIAGTTCTCRPPEGTWCGSGYGDECPGTTQPTRPYDICASNLANNQDALADCQSCMDQEGIWTAVGCIEQDPKSMVAKIVNIGIGILGGVFLLRVLAAAFTLTISQGDVKRTSEAKEMITESVIGVLFVLFSVTILQFIGSDVLNIPGFGG